MDNPASRKSSIPVIRTPGYFKPAGPFLICVLLATAVWCINALNKTHVTVITVPVVTSATNGNAHPNEKVTMTIELTGRGFDLIRFLWLRKKTFEPVHDPAAHRKLSSLEAAEQYLGSAAKSIRITSAKPEWIDRSGDALYSRMVKIIPRTVMQVSPGFVASIPPVVEPDSIRLNSLTRIPDSVRTVFTLPLKNTNLKTSWFGSVAIDTSSLGNVIPERKRVWIYQKVEQSTECEIEVIVQPGKNIPRNFRFIPSTITIRCSVPLSRYDITTADKFEAIADVNSSQQSRATVRITRMPSWVSNIQYEPVSIGYLQQVQ